MQQLSRSFHGALRDMGTHDIFIYFRYFKARSYFEISNNFRLQLRANPYLQLRCEMNSWEQDAEEFLRLGPPPPPRKRDDLTMDDPNMRS